MASTRGELKSDPLGPKVWFTSIESLAKVLSDRNRALAPRVNYDDIRLDLSLRAQAA